MFPQPCCFDGSQTMKLLWASGSLSTTDSTLGKGALPRMASTRWSMELWISAAALNPDIGALIVRIGFWCILFIL